MQLNLEPRPPGGNWRRPEKCADCGEALDYDAGKWMCVEVQPAQNGRPSVFRVVCSKCWRMKYRPRPRPMPPGLVGELAAKVRRVCRQIVAEEFSRRITATWVAESRRHDAAMGGSDDAEVQGL